ncbi:MAG TPA: hypothetical protein VG369_07035, partial [Humibacter sp.]|nr:hypothetical protein [Humibacter sp.]
MHSDEFVGPLTMPRLLHDVFVRSSPIYVEIEIHRDVEAVWRLTQDSLQHPRWDLRFSSITRSGELPSGGYRFRYERRLPFHTIVGIGTS